MVVGGGIMAKRKQTLAKPAETVSKPGPGVPLVCWATSPRFVDAPASAATRASLPDTQ